MILSILFLDECIFRVHFSQHMHTSHRHIQHRIIEFDVIFRSLNTDVVGLQFQIVARRYSFAAFGHQLLHLNRNTLISQTKELHQLLRISHRYLRSRHLILQVPQIILLLELGDVGQRQQFTLSRRYEV